MEKRWPLVQACKTDPGNHSLVFKPTPRPKEVSRIPLLTTNKAYIQKLNILSETYRRSDANIDIENIPTVLAVK